MSEGQIMYQGPPGKSVSHFESLGYRLLPDVDPADFLLAVSHGQEELDFLIHRYIRFATSEGVGEKKERLHSPTLV